MRFVYWSNKGVWHQEKLAEIEADNILEADQKFEAQTGFNPVKNVWIGCAVGTNASRVPKFFRNGARMLRSLLRKGLRRAFFGKVS